VPELEDSIRVQASTISNQMDTISTLRDQIHVQASTLTDRAETIARLEKELSEARFREQIAKEAQEKAITTLRDIVDFANIALPVPAKPEVVEEAPKPEPIPLESSEVSQSGEVTSGSNNEYFNDVDLDTIVPEPVVEPKPYAGQSWKAKPNWMANSEWEGFGG